MQWQLQVMLNKCSISFVISAAPLLMALTNNLYHPVESHFSSKKEIVCPQQTVLLCYRLKFSQ
jgi:hypothetical protein